MLAPHPTAILDEQHAAFRDKTHTSKAESARGELPAEHHEIRAFVSALTTLLLIFLPAWYLPAEGFDGRMARVHDPAYVLRSWVYLVHPFLVLMAALGVGTRLRFVAPGPVLVGSLGFLLWAFTEAAQQTMTLFAFDRWRVAYLLGRTLIGARLWRTAKVSVAGARLPA